jgi:hypothetical protein
VVCTARRRGCGGAHGRGGATAVAHVAAAVMAKTRRRGAAKEEQQVRRSETALVAWLGCRRWHDGAARLRRREEARRRGPSQ